MNWPIRIVTLATALAVAAALSGCGADDGSMAAAGTDAMADDDSDPEHGDEADHDDNDDEADHKDEDHDDHDDEVGAGMGAHAHGVAELSVAWSEGEMIIDLISPTYNIFGFEYEPTTDEDQAIVADRTDVLSEPGLLVVNVEAGCALADEVATELEFEGSHAEMIASWFYTCDNPGEIRNLDTAELFAEFPNLEEVEAQWASAAGQPSAELTPSETVLSLEQ